MKDFERSYPLFSACGLNCGLCPSFYTDGPSRCPGCGGAGFASKRPSCGTLSCCRKKGLEYCCLCDEYPCARLAEADRYDSFITHRNMKRDCEKAGQAGMAAYSEELNAKAGALRELLENYNDGRRKSFYCLAVNLLDWDDVRSVMEELGRQTQGEALSVKQKAALAVERFNQVAQQRGIPLRLNKKKG